MGGWVDLLAVKIKELIVNVVRWFFGRSRLYTCIAHGANQLPLYNGVSSRDVPPMGVKYLVRKAVRIAYGDGPIFAACHCHNSAYRSTQPLMALVEL